LPEVFDFKDQVALYVNNAVNLSNSLRQQGVEFTLLTNKKDIADKVCTYEGKILQIKEIDFLTKIPSGTKFYSAHFKLDVFRYLSSISHEYAAFCDLDMVCINAVPACLVNNISSGIPMYYDISDQVIPAYGHDVIMRDMESIHNLKSEGRWAGGEFISGTPEFFVALSAEISSIFDNYIQVIDKLHHVGDEAIVSAALEILRRKGIYIADAGTLGVVGRFWNCSTLHPQKPFDYFKKCFLLHLPADKIFLAKMAAREPNEQAIFLTKYIAYKKVLSVKKRIKQIIKSFITQ
jgi:hypothetical protein